MKSMAQPAFETANALQAALPIVLRVLPSFILATVALYATSNYISYDQLRRKLEVRQKKASEGDSARQEKLKRLGLGQVFKEEQENDEAKE
ncbi:hypothetical protein WJX81_002344 [Elliptochloris bilobata]|uniref:Uncharacterized protein n=1 Tax=Elliptochloris bilobata TaxID=381761 RepID=A0AAW1R1S0_9CHLO